MEEATIGRLKLSDEELGQASGGAGICEKMIEHKGDQFLYWTGGTNNRDKKFLCPKCGRPLHWGTGRRYYCDPCDESWFDEYALVPNLSSGLWVKI